MDVHGNDNTPEWGYCQVASCREPAIPCWLPDSDCGVDEPDDLLCANHCQDAGYCWGCGQFWAGIESFDFNPLGLCENCADEFREPEYEENSDLQGYIGMEFGL